jgi:predicted dehydrogenase
VINIAIVGCGYWGVNYVRVFSELPDAKVALVCDANEERLRAVRERFPLISTTPNWEEAVTSKWVDAVVIATPATSHFAIAERCLSLGKHVLVEKPVTTSVEEGEVLVQTARRHERLLMVGHTFLYNAGIHKMKDLVSSPEFGKIYYLHATRTNMGPVRHDVNALWDLAAHDIAIFNYLLDADPQWVSAVGSRVLGSGREDVGFATLCYPDNVIANVHISWVDPNKVREVVVVGSQRRIVFDDLNNLERVRIFEKGMASSEMEVDNFGEFRLVVRDGDIISPRVEASEPLKVECQHFLDCIGQRTPPRLDGQSGVEVVRVLQAIDQSIRNCGAPVSVSSMQLQAGAKANGP